MSQFQNSLEFLLKIRAEGQQVLDQVSAQINQFADAQSRTGAANIASVGPARQSAGATGELVEAQKQATQAIAASNTEITLQRGALGGLAAQVRTAAAAYIGLAGVRRALSLASAQEQAEVRVLGLLQAQLASREDAIAKQQELVALSQRLQREIGLFGDEQFLGAARQLISIAGGSNIDFERLLRVSADAAVALYDGNLETAVRNIARTFGGQAGEIGEVIPELAAIRRELAPAQFARQLQEGLVVDLLEGRFSGVAGAAAASSSGQLLAFQNRFNDLLERLGFTLLPVVNSGLEVIVVAFEGLARFLDRFADEDSGSRSQSAPEPSALQRTFAGASRDTLDAASAASLFLSRAAQERFSSLDRAGLGDGALAELNRSLGELFSEIARDLGGVSDDITSALEVFEDGIETAQLSQALLPEQFVTRIDFDDETRRALAQQLGIVDEITASVFEAEDAFKRLGALDEFPKKLFEPIDGEALREAQLFFNISRVGIDQETALRDLAEAQNQYNDAVRRANDLVEAGQLSEARRNEIIAQARENLRGLIGDTEQLAEVSRSEIREAVEGLQSLADAEGTIAFNFQLDAETQLTTELDKALAGARDRLIEGADEIGALSAEFGQRAFGPLVSELDDVFKTGEASFTGFATAILDTATRLFSEIVIGDLLAVLLGGTRQNIGVGGGGLLSGVFAGLGSFLGFDEGGVVPGPDLGRDSRIIAVRGGEYVVRPEPIRVPGVLEHLAAVNRGDLSSIDFSRLVPRMPEPFAAMVRREARSAPGGVPGYAGGGFVDAFASVASGSGSSNAADAVFGPARGSRSDGVTIVPVLPLDRRTIETINNNRVSRDTIGRIARDATSATTSGSPGARGMRS